MKNNTRQFRSLEDHLQSECELYQDYLKLLQEQGRSVTKFNLEKLKALNLERAKYSRMMAKAQEKRVKLMEEFPESNGKKLSELIVKYCEGREEKILLNFADQLKALVLKCRIKDLEFNQVVNFALNTINGSLSLMCQASQNMTKSYSPHGVEQQCYSPKQSRTETVLKEA